MKTIDTISTTVYRRFILGLQGLWPGRRWSSKQGTTNALHTMEALQIDPVSVVAQSHDIVLWGRVAQYQSEYLNTLLYTERKFFDYGGWLMIYPIEELPFQRVKMEWCKAYRRLADFLQANQALVERVRSEIRTRGPLRSRDIEGKSVDHYRSGKDAGVAMYYLWLIGELMIHSRHGKERIYGFLKDLAPDHLQWTAGENDAIQHFTRKAIAQLGFVTEREFHKILKTVTERPVDAQEMQSKLTGMLESGQLSSVRLENNKDSLYYLSSNHALLKSLCDDKIPARWKPVAATTEEEVLILSPLEYVSARGRAKQIFGFDYSWEIYKPAHTRKYGPYTIPILYGDRLVVRMDVKLDRRSQTLLVNGFWLEEWFKPDGAFALAFSKGLLNFSRFLGAQQVGITPLNPGSVRKTVAQYLRANDMGCV